uniref:Uncharacterized protein n=1 Tax=Anopheles atroparvus TaxID=41427 RepID=A0A182ITS8_ANOAO
MAIRIINHQTAVKGHVVLVLLVLLLFQTCRHRVAGLAPTVPATGQTKLMLKESLLIPSMDPEKEAKAMYEKALQQYGIYGKTLKEICKAWVTRGCQCTGTKEEVTLVCRGIGLDAVPADLPSELVKLDDLDGTITPGHYQTIINCVRGASLVGKIRAILPMPIVCFMDLRQPAEPAVA